MKKDQKLPKKTFRLKIVQENNCQITQIVLDNNHFIIKIIEVDHQFKEIHEISHKTDIVHQIFEITIQDQIQTKLSFRLMPFPFKF